MQIDERDDVALAYLNDDEEHYGEDYCLQKEWESDVAALEGVTPAFRHEMEYIGCRHDDDYKKIALDKLRGDFRMEIGENLG